MKSLFAIVTTVVLGSTCSVAVAQAGDVPAKSAAEVAKASSGAKRAQQKKSDFAAQEAALQKASTPGRELVDNPVNKSAKPSDPLARTGDKKEDFAAQETELQK